MTAVERGNNLGNYPIDDEMQIALQLGRRLVGHWKSLVAAAVIGAAGGFAFALRQPDSYSASVTVKVEAGHSSDQARDNLTDLVVGLNGSNFVREGVIAELIKRGEMDPQEGSGDIHISAAKKGASLMGLAASSSDPDKAYNAAKVLAAVAQNEALDNYKARVEQAAKIREQLSGSASSVSNPPAPVIISESIAATRPTTPNNKDRFARSSIIGGIVGLGATLGSLLLAGLWRGRIEDEEQAKRLLGYPVLAEIQMPKGFKRFTDSVNGDIWSAQNGVNVLAFSELKERVDRVIKVGGGGSFITIGSLHPGEGKTSVALGLAARNARLGDRKVLLIDLDFHRSSMVEKLGLNEGNDGLVELLRKKQELSWEDIRRVVVNTEHGFDLIIAGGSVANPSVLLESPGFKRLVEMLKGEYRYIIGDMPPDVAGPDSRIAASLSDVQIFVVGTKTNGNAQGLPPVLAEHGKYAPVGGLVVNGVPYRQNQYHTSSNGL